jgi:hypothetical protein
MNKSAFTGECVNWRKYNIKKHLTNDSNMVVMMIIRRRILTFVMLKPNQKIQRHKP